MPAGPFDIRAFTVLITGTETEALNAPGGKSKPTLAAAMGYGKRIPAAPARPYRKGAGCGSSGSGIGGIWTLASADAVMNGTNCPSLLVAPAAKSGARDPLALCRLPSVKI